MRTTRRDFLASVSVDTLDVLREGFYVVNIDGTTKKVELAALMNTAKQNTPGDFPRQTLDNEAMLEKNCTTVISVECCTSLAGARKLAETKDDIAVLNFASAKNPGGGFLKGSLAQEESLARASGLYPCLTLDRVSQYYQDNSRDRTCLYTHNIIYSPNVPVFKDDSTHELLHEPVLLSFISSPAVNAGHALERVGDPAIVSTTLLERMERVLAVAALNNHRHLVLGAWGCGVFGNSTIEVALMWRRFLLEGKFKNTFETVVFAITDEKVVQVFEEVMDPETPMSSFKIPAPTQGRGGGRGGRGRGGRGRGDAGRGDRKQANMKKYGDNNSGY